MISACRIMIFACQITILAFRTAILHDKSYFCMPDNHFHAETMGNRDPPWSKYGDSSRHGGLLGSMGVDGRLVGARWALMVGWWALGGDR